MPLTAFHPAVAGWFRSRFPAPTPAQERAWPALHGSRHALVAAPTGSGKTLAAFLCALDTLVREAQDGGLPDETRVLYVSPLKALSADVALNLEQPLAGIRAELARLGLPDAPIRTALRTGDTPSRERQAALRRPPHVFVTTPESLFILLTSEGGRRMLASVRTVIVDEIHAVAGSQRGAHLALTLERLESLTGTRLQRIGLSATQRPLAEVARLLVGTGSVAADGTPDCAIVDVGHARQLDLAVELGDTPLAPVMSTEAWAEIHERLATLIAAHRTTLVFVNTRRLSERLARHLSEKLGEDAVTSHHGSLSRDQRLAAEERLRSGRLRALVATASLELGIDIGHVDLVCQVGSTRSIATLLQRAGRSGHAVGALPKARLFPTSRDELVECAALLACVRRGELDVLRIPPGGLAILAQQLVAEAACVDLSEDGAFELARRAWPYRALARGDFDAVVAMLAEGFTTRRGRRSAHLHRDAVNGRLRGRRGARLAAITSGGAIPDTADFDVVLEPAGTRIGSVNEDFAIESIAGDIFQLANTSWRILRVEGGRVRVEDAAGQPPSIPFWLGEAPARSDELSAAVSRLREELSPRLVGTDGSTLADDPGAVKAASAWLGAETGLGASGCEQVIAYLAASAAALGGLPTLARVVLERFFDEAGDMHLVLHSPRGSRINRAWGLALRKRFCRKFNFELQAAATEDSVVLSLGPTHSFALEEVFTYLHSTTVRDVLGQAVLAAPLFATRWRWTAMRALALLRQQGGRRVPPYLLRMQAEDLLAVVFPDQLACAENLAGRREIPDHPLVTEVLRDCLEEAMDVVGLERLLQDIESGAVTLVAKDLREPSPLAAEVLSARPYAFLDDAPLEERRTQAIRSRRWLDPADAAALGTLDPLAVARVREEAWPAATTPDELHDALVLLGFVTAAEMRASAWDEFLAPLLAERRATRLARHGCESLVVAAERIDEALLAFEGATLDPLIATPPRLAKPARSREEAVLELLRGRLEGLGPVTIAGLAQGAGLHGSDVQAALLALETEGFVLRGRFTQDAASAESAEEWCERRLLARIHRHSLDRLRREIDPVPTTTFLRFLGVWHGLWPASAATEDLRPEGREGLAAALAMLEGFEAPAAAWESDVLPARLRRYDPDWLDGLCLSGRVTWARLSPPARGPAPGDGEESGRRASPVRTTPIALLPRQDLAAWSAFAPARDAGSTAAELPPDHGSLTAAGRAVRDVLLRQGASFLPDISAASGLLASQVEEGLRELVAEGRVTCDGFGGLRALLAPAGPRPTAQRFAKRRERAVGDAGRWTLLPGPTDSGDEAEPDIVAVVAAADDRVERVARALLARYGVVFKRLLERESLLPPWRLLLRCLHRLEARGEIRGGRFVDGVIGEQFALSEAVGLLRELRRLEAPGALVSLSAADPLNLVGILTPGPRVPALASNRILFQDGLPVATLSGGQAQFSAEFDPAARWEAEKILRRSGQARAPRAAAAAAGSSAGTASR